MHSSDTKHILVADDDRASRWIVERMLTQGIPGVRVSGVDDGAQALEVLAREPVDLLVTDLSMPVLDGIELLLEISRRRLPIALLVMTASNSPVAQSQALSSGAIEFFVKPILRGSFLDRVRELLFADRHRAQLDIVSLAGVVRMIVAEAKTCALRVATRGAFGLLVFADGALVDARQGSLIGLPAARAIFAWEDPTVTLDGDTRPGARTIDLDAARVLALVGGGAATRGAARWSERSPGGAAGELVERPPEYTVAASPPQLSRIGLDSTDPPPPPRLTMPAPMPPPAALREPLHIVPAPTDLPEIADVRRVPPPPRLVGRAVVRHAKPPPVPPPPVVAAPPRAAPSTSAAVVPPKFTPATPAPAAAAPAIRASAADTGHAPAARAADPASGQGGAAAVRPSPAAAPAGPREAPADESAADIDFFELLDRARDLLRAADLDGAERVLRRALAARPGDRVVQQNLRALARRRGDSLESKHP